MGYSTHSDIAAMNWIKNNTPEDALILNAPTFNGHWVPVISERKTIFFRNQPFFDKSGDQELTIMQTECKQAFYHPDCEESRAIINKYNITHIILPDRKLGRTFDSYYLTDHIAFSRADYLTLVFEEGNAKVYRVTDSQF